MQDAIGQLRQRCQKASLAQWRCIAAPPVPSRFPGWAVPRGGNQRGASIQACAGSFRNTQSRFGPAMTLR